MPTPPPMSHWITENLGLRDGYCKTIQVLQGAAFKQSSISAENKAPKLTEFTPLEHNSPPLSHIQLTHASNQLLDEDFGPTSIFNQQWEPWSGSSLRQRSCKNACCYGICKVLLKASFFPCHLMCGLILEASNFYKKVYK